MVRKIDSCVRLSRKKIGTQQSTTNQQHTGASDYGNKFGEPECAVDMTFDFAQLVAHAAKTRPLSAGSIVGSGTISNKLDDGPGKPVAEGGKGYSCIAEIRMIETIYDGAAKTPFMTPGDTVRIEMLDKDGKSIFGAIEQKVVRYEG